MCHAPRGHRHSRIALEAYISGTGAVQDADSEAGVGRIAAGDNRRHATDGRRRLPADLWPVPGATCQLLLHRLRRPVCPAMSSESGPAAIDGAMSTSPTPCRTTELINRISEGQLESEFPATGIEMCPICLTMMHHSSVKRSVNVSTIMMVGAFTERGVG